MSKEPKHSWSDFLIGGGCMLVLFVIVASILVLILLAGVFLGGF